MMIRNWVLGIGMAATLVACGGDDSEAAGEADRGGPDALVGFSWQIEQSVNGIDFATGFEFKASTVAVRNVCTVGAETLTAQIEVPIQYRYNATVRETKRAGSDACFVEVNQGSFDFKLEGDRLIATSGDEVVEFASAGGNSGLYGDWVAKLDGLELRWSMGDGKIVAQATCAGVSDSPSVSVPTDFVNFVDILEADEDMVGDDAFNCSVGVKVGVMEYSFDGDSLILTSEGVETRLDPA